MLAIVALWMVWNEWRQPTYLPPRGDEIDIVLELAGVFPDNYGHESHAVMLNDT